MKKKFSDLPLRIGVGIVVLNKNNKVFVAKRIDNPKNFWQMPQGGVDNGEDFYQAALRELEEETSIKTVKLINEIDKFTTYYLPHTNYYYLRLAIYLPRLRECVKLHQCCIFQSCRPPEPPCGATASKIFQFVVSLGAIAPQGGSEGAVAHPPLSFTAPLMWSLVGAGTVKMPLHLFPLELQVDRRFDGRYRVVSAV